MLNNAVLIGNLVRDPELKFTSNGKANCKLTLAINRFGTEHIDFPQVNVWGKQAENCGKYLKKGSKVAVEGSISTNKYTNKDGKVIYTTEVLAQNIEFLSSVSKEDNFSKQETAQSFDDFQSVEDDSDSDVPF